MKYFVDIKIEFSKSPISMQKYVDYMHEKSYNLCKNKWIIIKNPEWPYLLIGMHIYSYFLFSLGLSKLLEKCMQNYNNWHWGDNFINLHWLCNRKYFVFR
jgi:hypothetical protein